MHRSTQEGTEVNKDEIVTLSDLCAALGFSRETFYSRIMPLDPPRLQHGDRGRLRFFRQQFMAWYFERFAKGNDG
jgi:predicted DNA-binding transcriptional regulator AlpA